MARITGLTLSVVLALLSSQPFGRPSLAGRVLGRQLGVLTCTATAATVVDRVGGSGYEIRNGLGDGGDHVIPEFQILRLIFLLKTETLFLGLVGPAEILDFLHYVKHNLLRASVTLVGGFVFAHISPSHVGSAVGGKGHTVGHLLSPAFGVESGVVPGLLAGIHVNPPLLMV